MNGSSNIRENYDRLAEEYARHIYDELRHKPFDRDLLDRFAAEVAGNGEVCDLGCGPGHVARYLRERGVPVFGIDLSPGMIEQAQQLNPEIAFRQGDMLSLDLHASTLAGITAFYAIVNIPPALLRRVFAEMARVLKPGGFVLLSFHVGDDTLRPAELWGQPVTMDFHLFPTATIVRLLEHAGLVVQEALQREPYPPDVEYQSRRAYIFARKPNGGH